MRKSHAVIAAVVVFGALSASAATLGGLRSVNLGADQTVVASCDTDGIDVAYTNTYDAASNSFRTTAATLSGVASACDGQKFELVLSNGSTAVADLTGTVATTAGSQLITLSAPVAASSITAASLVVAG